MSLRKQFDVRHPFFRPFWRRFVFFGLIAGWAGYESISDNGTWAAIFGVAAAYLFYEFFVVFDPANYTDKTDEE